MRRYAALYLGLCHAWGWTPNDEGLRAFVRQMPSGLRDQNGRMRWPETT